MVDFVRETPLSVRRAAELLGVNPMTVRRWFKRGLDNTKVGGRVMTSREALNRFQKNGDSQQVVQAILVDRETLAAIKSLRAKGINFALEGNRDGSSEAGKTKTKSKAAG